MTSRRSLTRRNLLRGAGVALALPWLETLAPRRARGAPASRARFVPIYFPMGTAPYWAPRPSDDPLFRSPLMAPLRSFLSQVTTLSNVANTAYDGIDPAPSFARETASFLTCAPAQGNSAGKSVDQVIADGLGGDPPSLRSLELGLSTEIQPDADLEAPFKRSISWRDATSPQYRLVNPQAVFDRIVSGNKVFAPPDAATLARRATHKSVLDYVAADAAALQKGLGPSDRARLDRFQTSVRSIETRLMQPTLPPACRPLDRPTTSVGVGSVPPGYDRNAHADLMIDLMVMALGCNSARVVSLMLDDGGSNFSYDFLTERIFTDTGSTLGTARVGAFRDLATADGAQDRGYPTITYWFVTKVAQLCRKLAPLYEDDGRSVLDNSLIWFGSGMHDARSRSPVNLPLLYVGSGGGLFKVGQDLDLQGKRSLSHLYYTLIQAFGSGDASGFGKSRDDVAFEILA